MKEKKMTRKQWVMEEAVFRDARKMEVGLRKGIQLALEGALVEGRTEETEMVAADSKAVIKAVGTIALSGRATSEERRKTATAVVRVKLVWVKSSLGLEGNELADEAAKEGTTEPEMKVVTSGGIRESYGAPRKFERENTDLGRAD